MATHPDIIIIGGGVIGLTAAYFLSREGVQVEVVDKGEFGREASWAGAGILPPGNPTRARTPYDQLRAHSAVLFPQLSAMMRERLATDNGYCRCGGLELDVKDHDPILQEWRDEGIACELLHDEQLHQLEPALSPALGKAYYLPDMAQVRSPWHLRALESACARQGVKLINNCPITGLVRESERITAVKMGVQTKPAGQFLLAAGAWTDELLKQVGWQRGIRPMRGQIALLNTGKPLFARLLLHGPRYLVPRSDGRVLVGSTEEDVGFNKHTTASAFGDLLDFARGLVPNLAEAHVESCWAGLRPGSPDGLPYLGRVPGFSNLFIAAGHYRAGLQTSPATGMVMKELLLGQKLTIPLESFRLDRPAGETYQSLFRS